MADGVFAARGLKRLDSWYVLEVAVDPDCEGKGARSPACPLCRRTEIFRAEKKPFSLSFFFL
jgi:hypothetical protein